MDFKLDRSNIEFATSREPMGGLPRNKDEFIDWPYEVDNFDLVVDLDFEFSSSNINGIFEIWTRQNGMECGAHLVDGGRGTDPDSFSFWREYILLKRFLWSVGTGHIYGAKGVFGVQRHLEVSLDQKCL